MNYSPEHPIYLSIDMEYRLKYQEIIDEMQITNPISFIAGGNERKNSVYNALATISESEFPFVVVHDAARPFASRELFCRVVEAAMNYGAAVPGVSISDSVKSSNINDFIKCTIDRSTLIRVQTPQAFSTTLLKNAYHSISYSSSIFTDESSIVERMAKVYVVEGEEANIKITYELDLEIAKLLAQKYIF